MRTPFLHRLVSASFAALALVAAVGPASAGALSDRAAAAATTGPTVSGVHAYFEPAVRLVGTTPAVWVLWTQANAVGVTGDLSAELWRSLSGGAYQRVWVSGDSLVPAALVPTTGTFRFRVRATDSVGDGSAWAYSPTYRAVLAQTSGGVSYWRAWHTAVSSAFSGGSTRYSTVAGATATFTFTGRSVALISTRGPVYGRMRVFVDGSANSTTVWCTAPTGRVVRDVVWSTSWGSVGRHTVKVVVPGTAGSPRIDLDAFLVLR